jgi:hypothetical protein
MGLLYLRRAHGDIGARLVEVEKLDGKRLVGPVPLPTGSFAWVSES